MSQRERTHDERDERMMPAAPAGGSSLLASAERLLARGSEAIDRALSQDSAAFLAANRQEGGQ